jgi:Calcium-dependent channel, 7TM region, putative phosphate/Cytosolic domain of 10TM putative phosphate transporter/Late exocytosis, associated with Golgi transport
MSASSSAALSPDSGEDPLAWYGSIQYLLNISAIGALFCLLLFLLVKLRFDHRRFPGATALLTKLLSVYHATSSQIALHCGADAAQFLLFERSAFLVLILASVTALAAALPLNLLAGSNPISDQFTATTISHIPKSSPLLWIHLLLAGVIVAIAHFGISKLKDDLRVTRFRDGQGNPSDPNSGSVAVFTIMIQGIPKSLASDKAPLEEYFQHRYPGKVYRVIVPFDLCSLEYLTTEWTKVTNQISQLEAQMNAQNVFIELNNGCYMQREHGIWKKAKELWALMAQTIGLSDEDRLRRLHTRKLILGSRLVDYRDGNAPGAGVAFVVFKDVYSANKAVRDFRTDRRKERPVGQFFPVMELQLGRSGWKVERAPPASDIYWNHLGLNKISLILRRVAVNTCLILMLLFFSSPLAIISGMQNAARIIDVEAMDQAKSWLDWLGTSSWFWTVLIQFMPNVLIFISMYVIIPSFLSYFSKFECHLTMSGEQRAALLKMVCFFLVNLILLRALVESSLESALLRMGQCYLDGTDCKRIEEYLSPSFLSRSSLSSLAFLITSTFLGISFDLLAPIPWIKHIFKKFKKNDMVQLMPEENEDYPLEQSSNGEVSGLTTPLVQPDSPNGIEGSARDLAVYPTNRSFHMPKQNFDFAQYYAFDLTIFALTMIYSLFAPLVVPVGAVYFGYRYLVDKYNFLFVYRVRGFPAGNDGKLMDRVLCIMQFCVVCFLAAMLLYFSVQGDPTKLEAIFTLGLLLFYKLLPSQSGQFQASLLEGMQSVDSFVDGPTDYEVFSNPTFDWDLYLS